MNGSKQAHPGALSRAGVRMKLHRRVLRLDGRDMTVLTLRPGTRARFSTYPGHSYACATAAWRVVTDGHGGRLLGRLLWGLAYQRVPDTLVLIDRSHLDPNPFDAGRSDPVALVPAHLTALSTAAARRLRRALPLRTRPEGTVGWYTPGLDRALAAQREERHRYRTVPGLYPGWSPLPDERGAGCDRIGGLIVLSARRELLKAWATEVYALQDYGYHRGETWNILPAGGEVELWRQYHRMVSAARMARRDLLAAPAPDPGSPGTASGPPLAGMRPEQARRILRDLSGCYQQRMIPARRTYPAASGRRYRSGRRPRRMPGTAR